MKELLCFRWRNQSRRGSTSNSAPWPMPEAQLGTEPALAKPQLHASCEQGAWRHPQLFSGCRSSGFPLSTTPLLVLPSATSPRGLESCSQIMLLGRRKQAHRCAGAKSCLLSQTSAVLGTDGCMHKDDRFMIKGYF